MARIRKEKCISYDDERCCFYVTLSSGSSTKSYKTAKTLTEARRILKEHQKQKSQGKILPISNDTLISRTESYIQYKSLTLADSTIYGYRMIAKNHLEPYFGNKKIQAITVSDIKQYITAASKKKLSRTSIRKHLDLLNAVFKEARREKIIAENPMEFIDKPPSDTNEKDCYNAQEISDLLASVLGTPIELPVFLAAYLGLRRGEIDGLKWENVDLENRIISIANSRTQVGSKISEKKPKTEKSNRKLSIPEPLYDALLREKNRIPTGTSMGQPVHHHDFVVRMRNGKPFRPGYISDAFSNHLKKHNMRHITFHALRHSYTSIAAKAGAPIQEISSSLGHANISVTTTIYTHEFDRVKSEATNAVAASISAVQNEAKV